MSLIGGYIPGVVYGQSCACCAEPLTAEILQDKSFRHESLPNLCLICTDTKLATPAPQNVSKHWRFHLRRKHKTNFHLYSERISYFHTSLWVFIVHTPKGKRWYWIPGPRELLSLITQTPLLLLLWNTLLYKLYTFFFVIPLPSLPQQSLPTDKNSTSTKTARTRRDIHAISREMKYTILQHMSRVEGIKKRDNEVNISI